MALQKIPGLFRKQRFLKDSGDDAFYDSGAWDDAGNDFSGSTDDGYTWNDDGSGSWTDDAGNVTAWDAEGNILDAGGYDYADDGSGSYTDPESGEVVSWDADGNIVSNDDGYTWNDDGSGSYTDAAGNVTAWDADGNIVSNDGEMGPSPEIDRVDNEDGSGSYTDETGTEYTWDAAGNVTQINPDGSGILFDADGSKYGWDANGNVLHYDASGNLLSDSIIQTALSDFAASIGDKPKPAKQPAKPSTSKPGTSSGSSSGSGISFPSGGGSKPSNSQTPAAKLPASVPPALAAKVKAVQSTGRKSGLGTSGLILLLGAAGAVLYFMKKKGR